MKIKSKYFPTLTEIKSGMVAVSGKDIYIFVEMREKMCWLEYGVPSWDILRDFDEWVEKKKIRKVGYPFENAVCIDYRMPSWDKITVITKAEIAEKFGIDINSFIIENE